MTQPTNRRLVTEAALSTALNSRLAAVEYFSGERNITSLVPNVTSGGLYVTRVGRTVWLDFRRLAVTPPEPTQGHVTFASLLPLGFRVARASRYLSLARSSPSYASGPVRLDANGNVIVYGAGGGQAMEGLIAFPTDDPIPVTPPGAPA